MVQLFIWVHAYVAVVVMCSYIYWGMVNVYTLVYSTAVHIGVKCICCIIQLHILVYGASIIW